MQTQSKNFRSTEVKTERDTWIMDIIAKLYKMSILMMWVKLHVPHCKGCVPDKIVANSRWAKVSGQKISLF